ncbi:MAG: response regulator [Methanomicrobiales archaeon]
MIRTPADILIVEDEVVIAMEIEASLQEFNYHVIGSVPSGEEALLLVAEKKPDLVLMDIGLRGDMDGIATADKLYRLFRVPVIFLTGRLDSGILEKALESQPFGYLVKPVGTGELSAAIEIALYKHRAFIAEEEVRHELSKLQVMDHITQYEIYNKTMVIQGYIDLLRKGNVTGGSPEQYFEKITELIRHIQRRILFEGEFSKIGQKKAEWQEIRTLVNNARFPRAPPGFVYEIKTGPLEVHADPLMSRVFMQLFENSVTHGKHADQISISFSIEDETGILTIADNGCGISAPEKSKIFSQDTGQIGGKGLFLVKEILAISNMTIQETGVAGEGSRFEIRIPPGRYRLKP